MTTEKKSDRWISDIVGVFCDPIIVMPGGWGEDLPDWLRNAITLERLMMNVEAIKTGQMTATDAEACAYLFTAALTAPPDHDWTQIYLYLATKVYERHRTKDSGVTMPTDIRVESLDDGQMRDLNRLKDWIYQTRTRARQEKDRAERRQRRQDEAARKEELQPKMFDF